MRDGVMTEEHVVALPDIAARGYDLELCIAALEEEQRRFVQVKYAMSDPIEMRCTPVAAMACTDSSETPPEASISARSPAIATASRICASSKLSSTGSSCSSSQPPRILTVNGTDSAFRIADRMVLLDRGKFIVSGTPSEMRDSTDPLVRQFVHGLMEGPLTERRRGGGAFEHRRSGPSTDDGDLAGDPGQAMSSERVGCGQGERPGRGAREERLADKRKAAERKQGRQRPRADD